MKEYPYAGKIGAKRNPQTGQILNYDQYGNVIHGFDRDGTPMIFNPRTGRPERSPGSRNVGATPMARPETNIGAIQEPDVFHRHDQQAPADAAGAAAGGGAQAVGSAPQAQNRGDRFNNPADVRKAYLAGQLGKQEALNELGRLSAEAGDYARQKMKDQVQRGVQTAPAQPAQNTAQGNGAGFDFTSLLPGGRQGYEWAKKKVRDFLAPASPAGQAPNGTRGDGSQTGQPATAPQQTAINPAAASDSGPAVRQGAQSNQPANPPTFRGEDGSTQVRIDPRYQTPEQREASGGVGRTQAIYSKPVTGPDGVDGTSPQPDPAKPNLFKSGSGVYYA